MAASLSYQSSVSSTSGLTSYTLAFTAASASGQERLVAISSISNGHPADMVFSNVVIDGQSATAVGSHVRVTDSGGTNGPVVAFFRAPGTASTSFNVTFNVNFAPFDARVHLWTLSNAGAFLASGSAALTYSGSGSNLSLNVSTVTDGAVAAAILAYNSATHTTTWVGLTERFDGTVLYGNDWTSAADLNVTSGSTSLTVTAQVPGDISNGAGVGLAVSFTDVDALVAHYPFDDTTTTDASGNGNTGILTGTGTTLVTGKIGSGALSFNGNGYVTFTSVAALGLATATSEFSCATWIKTSQTDATILCLRNSGSGNQVILFCIGYNFYDNAFTGRLSCLVRDDAGTGVMNVNSTAAVNDNAWHHVAVTRNSSKLLTLYIDGVSAGTATDTMTGALTPNLAGSAVAYEIYTAVRTLTGSLDDFRIYKRALTSTEVAALYALGTGGTTTTLTAAAGSYALTGTAATVAYKLTAAAGSYTLTGTAAPLLRRQTAAAGTYALTGTAATVAYKFTAAAGSYTLTGTAASFAYKLSSAAGSYALTGSAAAFPTGNNVILATDPGAYTITGTAAAFITPLTLTAEAGSYALTGSAATFATATTLTAAAGAYALTGTAATFATSGNIAFFCGSGAYALTGSAATFPVMTCCHRSRSRRRARAAMPVRSIGHIGSGKSASARTRSHRPRFIRRICRLRRCHRHRRICRRHRCAR